MRPAPLILGIFVALFAVNAAQAQNAIVPTAPNGDDTNRAANTAFVQNAFAGGSHPALTNGHIFVGNGGVATDVPMTGDCSISYLSGDGKIVCTKTNGTAFGTFATQNYATPPAIGGTTPAAGSFTDLSSSGTVSGSGFSTYLASPPAIGGTTAAAGTFTSLTANGVSIDPSSSATDDVLYDNGSGYIHTAVMSLLNYVCDSSTLRADCVSFFGYADPRWWGATCGSGDSTTALQDAVNYVDANYSGGGEVRIACAYYVSSTITMPDGVRLWGVARDNAAISSNGADIEVLNFTGGSNSYGGMSHIWIIGDQTTGATQVTVNVFTNAPVYFNDFNIWGGKIALNEAGVDGRITNGYVTATGSGGEDLRTLGANWYVNVKFDNTGTVTGYGALINSVSGATGVQENHFVNCDFSGSWTQSAVGIDDSAASARVAVTIITNSVFSNGTSGSVYVANAKWTALVGDEIGGTVTVNSLPMSIGESYGFTGVAATGATCAASNYNVSC